MENIRYGYPDATDDQVGFRLHCLLTTLKISVINDRIIQGIYGNYNGIYMVARCGSGAEIRN